MPAIINYKEEYDQGQLWVPRHSDLYQNMEWVRDNIDHTTHSGAVNLIVPNELDNILTGENLQILFTIHALVNSLKTSRGTSFNDICHKMPSLFSTN